MLTKKTTKATKAAATTASKEEEKEKEEKEEEEEENDDEPAAKRVHRDEHCDTADTTAAALGILAMASALVRSPNALQCGSVLSSVRSAGSIHDIDSDDSLSRELVESLSLENDYSKEQHGGDNHVIAMKRSSSKTKSTSDMQQKQQHQQKKQQQQSSSGSDDDMAMFWEAKATTRASC